MPIKDLLVAEPSKDNSARPLGPRALPSFKMKSSLPSPFKTLVSKIHPPLTPTPRQSQQLLGLLTESFRRQLKAEPVFGDEEAINTVASSARARVRPEASGTLQSPSASANLHLHSILTDPLFAHRPVTIPRRSTDLAQDRDAAEMRRVLTEPMALFNEKAARGTATLDLAKRCLQSRLAIDRSSPESGPSKDSKAGATMLQWLWSSGLEDERLFLEDEGFLRALVPFLVAEGLQEKIWTWIGILLEAHPGHDLKMSNSARILFRRMVMTEVKYPNGLESALNQYFRLHRILPEKLGSLLQSAGRYLTSQMLSTSVPIEAALYDRFLNTLRKDDPIRARLLLHHPVSPQAGAAIDLLRKVSGQDEVLLRRAGDEKQAKRRLELVRIGLESAELLLRQDKNKSAAWVMAFLQTHFSWELGLDADKEKSESSMRRQRRRVPATHDEQADLDILEGLGMEHS